MFQWVDKEIAPPMILMLLILDENANLWYTRSDGERMTLYDSSHCVILCEEI